MAETPVGLSSEEDNEIRLLDIALALAEHWRFIVFTPLAAGAIALGASHMITPTFTATTRILPPAQQQNTSAALASQLGALAGLVGGSAALKNPSDQYVSLLKSRTVFDAIVRRFDLKELYEAQYFEDARRVLGERSRISAGIRDGIISIEVDDRDPTRAAAIANGFVEELRNLTTTLAISEAAQRRLFFEEQLAKAKEDLTRSEIQLQTSGVSESTLRTIPQSALESLARLKAQITAQEIKLASMRTFMTDANPEFTLAVQELTALRAELSKAEGSTPAATGKGAKYIAKYRDFKYHETLFELMAKQFELARLDEAREGAVIQVVDAAKPPERKSKPVKSRIAILTTFIAFLLALIGVFLRRSFRVAADRPETAEKLRRVRELLSLRQR